MKGWKGYSAKKQQEDRFKDLEAELDNYKLKEKRKLDYKPQSALKKETRFEGPRNQSKKPVDDDTDEMNPKQKAEHRDNVLEYNKNTSRPMNNVQKRKIKEQLADMDPNDPEAKLLRDMLNIPKNQ